MSNNLKKLLSKAEDIADEVLRHGKHVFPHLARFCLVSTFIEDGLRMWSQWSEQQDHVNNSWGIGWFLSACFVLFNFLGQLGGSVMVLFRLHVVYACGLLFLVVILQTVAYSIIWYYKFLLRNMSLVGALLLLIAEIQTEKRSLFAGVPSLGKNKPKNYLQFSGRLLLVLMFITILHFEFDFLLLLQAGVATILMGFVVVGYKTKLSALLLVLWLSALNVYFNCWWTVSSLKLTRDFMKYDFFQTLSVIGGLLMVVSLGPGGVSIDSYKKKW